MVPREDMCKETRDDGRQPLTTIFVQILHQQYDKISRLFTSEPTYTLHFILFRAFFPVTRYFTT